MMMKRLASRLLRTTSSGAATFAHDRKGIAAIEFAMVMPIMIVLFFGALEFSQALTVDRRVTQVASSTADLVAQTDKITSADLADIMSIIQSLVQPYSATPLKVSISSVKQVGTNTPTVVWNYTYNGGAAYSGNYTGVPTGLLNAAGAAATVTSSVIVAEVTYNFTPTIAQFLTAGVTLSEKFYLKPRKSLCVWKTDTSAAMCG